MKKYYVYYSPQIDEMLVLCGAPTEGVDIFELAVNEVMVLDHVICLGEL